MAISEMSSEELELELKRKGMNAPRLSPTIINEQIVSEQYYVFPNTTLTVCCLTLKNGFCVIGESASASPENFDADIDKRVAKDNARQKIWPLEGYLLRSKLAKQI